MLQFLVMQPPPILAPSRRRQRRPAQLIEEPTGMSSSASSNDPLAFGRQLWQQWNDALQAAAPIAPAQMPDWSAALRNWSSVLGPGSTDAGRAADKLGLHGQQFLTLMQELVQRASSGSAAAADLSSLWRGALGGDGNPMLDALRQVSTEGARGWEQLAQTAREAVEPVKAELAGLLKVPGFGLGRERQAQLADLIAAQAAQAEAAQAYQRLLFKASEQGMERFEGKLAERSEPGRQIDSMRALYDLWIDAAEEAYAQVALSPEFREVYGNLVNTQMRAKRLQQQEVERHCREFGMPTRSELDGVLRRLHDLQRDMRALRSALNQAAGTAAPHAAAAATTRSTGRSGKSAATASSPRTKPGSVTGKSGATAAKVKTKTKAAVASPSRAGGKSKAAPVAKPGGRKPAAPTRRRS